MLVKEEFQRTTHEFASKKRSRRFYSPADETAFPDIEQSRSGIGLTQIAQRKRPYLKLGSVRSTSPQKVKWRGSGVLSDEGESGRMTPFRKLKARSQEHSPDLTINDFYQRKLMGIEKKHKMRSGRKLRKHDKIKEMLKDLNKKEDTPFLTDGN